MRRLIEPYSTTNESTLKVSKNGYVSLKKHIIVQLNLKRKDQFDLYECDDCFELEFHEKGLRSVCKANEVNDYYSDGVPRLRVFVGKQIDTGIYRSSIDGRIVKLWK